MHPLRWLHKFIGYVHIGAWHSWYIQCVQMGTEDSFPVEIVQQACVVAWYDSNLPPCSFTRLAPISDHYLELPSTCLPSAVGAILPFPVPLPPVQRRLHQKCTILHLIWSKVLTGGTKPHPASACLNQTGFLAHPHELGRANLSSLPQQSAMRIGEFIFCMQEVESRS